MFLTFLNNQKYSVLINRDKLKTSFNSLIDFNEIIIYDILLYNYYINESLYNGTIIDGKLTTIKNYNVFSIVDIYYNSGINLLELDLLDKINDFNKFIDNNDKNLPIIKKKIFLENIKEKINTLEVDNNIDFDNGSFNDYLNQLKKTCHLIYEMKTSRYVLKENIEKFLNEEFNENCVEINGLIFKSEKSGYYYIYSNKNEFSLMKSQLKNSNNINVNNIQLDKISNDFIIKKSIYPYYFELHENGKYIDLIKINNYDFSNKFNNCNQINISKNELFKYNQNIII